MLYIRVQGGTADEPTGGVTATIEGARHTHTLCITPLSLACSHTRRQDGLPETCVRRRPVWGGYVGWDEEAMPQYGFPK